jgi:hypothetical protein
MSSKALRWKGPGLRGAVEVAHARRLRDEHHLGAVRVRDADDRDQVALEVDVAERRVGRLRVSGRRSAPCSWWRRRSPSWRGSCCPRHQVGHVAPPHLVG